MDSTTVAALLAGAVGIMKIIEKLIDWGFSKYTSNKPANTTIVQLDPQASAAIVEILKRTEKMEDLLSPRDSDGVPLVYFPRSSFHDMVARQRATLDKLDDLGNKIASHNKE